MYDESELSFSKLSYQEQYEMCMKAADELLRVIMSMTLKECTQIDLGQVLIYYQWSNADDTTRDDLRGHLEEYDRSGRICQWKNKKRGRSASHAELSRRVLTNTHRSR